MPPLIFLIFLGFVCRAQIPMANDTIILSNHATRLIFQLCSPVVTIVPNHLLHPEEQYIFAWTLITEKNSSIDSPPVRTFAFTNLSYSNVTKTTTPDNSLQTIDMFSSIRVTPTQVVKFKITYSLYENSTRVNTTAGRVGLWGGAFHYALTVSDWPFEDAAKSDHLEIAFSLSSATSNSTSFGHDTSNDQLMFVDVAGPDSDSFVARVPKIGRLSPFNTSENMEPHPIGINVMLSLQSKFSIGVSLLVPKFRELYLDGIVSVDSATPLIPFRKASNAGLILIIFLSLSGGFLFLFGIVTAFFHWRREDTAVRYL